MWGLKGKFDKYVASQPIVAQDVYGSKFSIKLNLDDVESKGFSSILGRYVNERKAAVDNRVAYIIPEYDQIQFKARDYKTERLLQYVNDQNFIRMMNFASIVEYAPDPQGKMQYYFKLEQDAVQRYQCMIIIALLMEAGLAIISAVDHNVYIIYNYQEKLEKTSKVQRDISGFRVLLGEGSNLNSLLNLVEGGEIRNGAVYISSEAVKDADFTVEIMSLTDIGMVQCIRDRGNEEKFKLDPFFSSWLLEYISNTSDRISFGDWYA